MSSRDWHGGIKQQGVCSVSFRGVFDLHVCLRVPPPPERTNQLDLKCLQPSTTFSSGFPIINHKPVY